MRHMPHSIAPFSESAVDKNNKGKEKLNMTWQKIQKKRKRKRASLAFPATGKAMQTQSNEKLRQPVWVKSTKKAAINSP